MKRIALLVMVMMLVVLAGCRDAEKEQQLITCQQEKQQLQTQLDQTLQEKDQTIDALKAEVREVNQKAMESVRTMMEKQHAKDLERKKELQTARLMSQSLQSQVHSQNNELKKKEAQIQSLQEQLDDLQEKAAKVDQLQLDALQGAGGDM